MDIEFVRRYMLPPGVVLSTTLIGLILIGVVLYTKADRAQRFLEPTLAISNPRIQFSGRFAEIVEENLSPEGLRNVLVSGTSIRVRRDNLFPEDFHRGKVPLISGIGRIFHTVMEDPQMSKYIDFILVVTRFPDAKEHGANIQARKEASGIAENVLNAMFAVSPDLEAKHVVHFASASIADPYAGNIGDVVEFHIIPSERMHIDLLMKLQRYLD